MIDAIASEDHFVDHILPVWLALGDYPPEARGSFYVRNIRPGVPGMVRGMPPPSRNHTLVAAAGDLKRARHCGRPTALMEHGCGQSFGGDPKSANYSSYAGGAGRDAQLFLHPGPHPAARDRARYPAARVEIVGCPKLDSLQHKARTDAEPVVAVSFHWDCRIAPETRSAAVAFSQQVAALAKAEGLTVIGHGHPRVIKRLEVWYRKLGIETVRSFEEVCARADVYVNDASSTLFEFASTGRPVVVLNPKIYRRDINHSLRFWEASTVGVQVGQGEDLVAAVREALLDPPERQAAREAALSLVYGYRCCGAERAAAVLMDWAS